MSRYYFDVHDGDGRHRDDMGDEFDSFEEARDQAQSLLPDIIRDELPDGELRSVSCEVRDEAGVLVYRGCLIFRGTRFAPAALAGSGDA